jgi:hypothetical protein
VAVVVLEVMAAAEVAAQAGLVLYIQVLDYPNLGRRHQNRHYLQYNFQPSSKYLRRHHQLLLLMNL